MTDTFDAGALEADGTLAELARLREQVRHLQARARNRPLIAEAQGILRERYRLEDAEAAFALMQLSSQRFNVRVRTLAEAVVRLERPDERADRWFPGRVRHPAPALDALGIGDAAHAHRGAVLSTVLSQTLAVAGTDMGNVQLGDHATGGLWMEKHTGLGDDFVTYFDFVGPDGTSCAQAAKDMAQVTVRDVATAPVFSEGARRTILHAGSRSCHSVPLVTGDRCLGMVSAHFDRPIDELHPAQLQTLEYTGRQVGRWLEWYDRTVVLDALEYLHLAARHPGMTRARRR
ncbi:GAF and ANTAR domain-containing protein [Streptomyces ficellus]|uniref:ANTAR domain-containing protein n=1 Tax=Streptomyces ficellus TaxID=1977088 RepID=A0A6I6F3F3_9ACTN|nr:ANTAR domain-containing protein [Streptomyces ficellus]QGV77164.1 ANTAR domain-containing protein [Streptomyces ficellus]